MGYEPEDDMLKNIHIGGKIFDACQGRGDLKALIKKSKENLKENRKKG